MKKFTLLALIGLLTLSFSLSAQNNNARRSWTAKDRAELMEKELKLSAEESSKLKALFEKMMRNELSRLRQTEQCREEL